MRLIDLYEGSGQADQITKITNDFIHNIVTVTIRGKSLFDVQTRTHDFGYTVILTTKVPDPSGYLRVFFRVLSTPSGEFLKDITNEMNLGAFNVPIKIKRYPIYDESSIGRMSVEQYHKEMLKRTRVWRYVFFGGHGAIGLIQRWSGSSTVLKALRLVAKQPPPLTGES